MLQVPKQGQIRKKMRNIGQEKNFEVSKMIFWTSDFFLFWWNRIVNES